MLCLFFAAILATLSDSRRTLPRRISCDAGTDICGRDDRAAGPLGAPEPDTELKAMQYELLPFGSIAPEGWLRAQLLVQANGLAGSLGDSTFPGAAYVNGSSWTGGDFKKTGGTMQWLPYWTNGQVPLAGLLLAAGIDHPVIGDMDRVMEYVLAHTNRTNGWIGPFTNEPGDGNGHGLWDPLNMLRSLFNWAQYRSKRESDVAAAAVRHLTAEAALLDTDPVIKWASTRWPTFVEICQYVIDKFIPKYGSDSRIMPLGSQGTRSLLLNASAVFAARGMQWQDYYHQNGSIKFPEGPVQGWNTNDHGVNNAEGAMRWPAVTWRVTGRDDDMHQQAFLLGMLDKFQGQPNALFCADEVFCGRAAHRGTETCAVVEAMASLEYAYEVFGDTPGVGGRSGLMDRVERLAFNALPAALTADMWTHVYVQQANSVFAGRTHPAPGGQLTSAYHDPSRRHHKLHYAHQRWGRGCTRCGDTPSGEDQTANYFGVSHFPCCITNFPQGWPKFAQHAILVRNDRNGVVVASLVPATAVIPADVAGGQGATITTAGRYPFADSATVTLRGAKRQVLVGIRIPGWADEARVNGDRAVNGSVHTVQCAGAQDSCKITIELNPTVRVERGWGPSGNSSFPATDGAAIVRGPLLFALHPSEDVVVTQSYNSSPPARPRAVDYQISTRDPWNYAIDVGQPGAQPPRFDGTPSPGWSADKLPFSTTDYPFSIEVRGRRLSSWGYWEGSNITANLPASPIDCATVKGGCGPDLETLRFVPFGGTNIRVAVFPWLKSAATAPEVEMLNDSYFLRQYYAHRNTSDTRFVATVPRPRGSSDEINWVSKGAVTKPTSQGRCATCQAFSCVADIEGAWFTSGRPLTKFSEQQMIDCGSGDAYGMKWVVSNGGIATAKAAPLANHSDPNITGCRGITDCSAVASEIGGFINGTTCLTNHDEENILALLQYGPLSVSINAAPLNGYKGGVINCTGEGVDHAVTLVAHGTEAATGQRYWTIKNSWGPDFGESSPPGRTGAGECGYARLLFGNQCLRGPCQSFTGSRPQWDQFERP